MFGSSARYMAELKFKVVDVDPISGDIEGDEEGFQEEYPLEDVEISSADFIAEVLIPVSQDYDCVQAKIGEFRQVWDSFDKSQEVLQKFSLQFKDLKTAIDAVISCLGMQSEDDTDIIDNSKTGLPHTLHLSGRFPGNLCILARAQLHIDDNSGCILKIAVRSPERRISALIAECIN
jgi:coatomer protein complex subunit gamma